MERNNCWLKAFEAILNEFAEQKMRQYSNRIENSCYHEKNAIAAMWDEWSFLEKRKNAGDYKKFSYLFVFC